MSAPALGKVLIVGSGQLGKALGETAPAQLEWIRLNRSELDVTDARRVDEVFDSIKPQTVINACAYTAVDRAETEKEQAFAVNEKGVAHLAQACSRIDAKFLHVSTDYVFDGRSGLHLKTDAETHPCGVYGLSKRAGENTLSNFDGPLRWAIVRTAWVYSNWGKNFLNTMLKLMSERDHLSVVFDQVGTPTSALTLAQTLWRLRERDDLEGFFHWTDAGVASWYDFAVAIGEIGVELGLLDKRIPIEPITTEDYPTPAPRPACALLDKRRCWQELDVPPTHWRAALASVMAAR